LVGCAALSCYGLHEIPTPQRVGAIAELARVLRQGGRLIIADLDSPPGGSLVFDAFIRLTEKPYVRDVFRSGLVDALRNAGFEILEHRPPAGFRLLPYQLIEARAA
jgi:ubiquinone/menaquinone biosynthesis C-methylase UbiE